MHIICNIICLLDVLRVVLWIADIAGSSSGAMDALSTKNGSGLSENCLMLEDQGRVVGVCLGRDGVHYGDSEPQVASCLWIPTH